MKNFKFITESSDQGTLIEFSGSMDENMVLPQASELFNQVVTIDFEEVIFINSLGIREWLSWLEKLKLKRLYFKNLPINIVDQVNMVQGFLPHGAEVLSFYVPFYCEDCDTETDHHFKDGQEYNWGGQNSSEKLCHSQKCEDCGSKLEIGVHEIKFFQFLNRAFGYFNAAA